MFGEDCTISVSVCASLSVPPPFFWGVRFSPRVNSLRSRLQRRLQYLIGVEVAFERLRWPNADGFIGHSHVRSLAGKMDQKVQESKEQCINARVCTFGCHLI